MKRKALLLILLVVVSQYACNESENFQPMNGKGKISIDLNLNITQSITDGRINDVAEVVTDNFEVIIYDDDDNTIKSFENYAEVPAEIILEAGSYRVTASSANLQPAAFDNPYYFGEAIFELTNGESETVNIECTLANCKVTVIYTENVINNFAGYSTIVSNKEGALTFTETEAKAGYFSLLPLDIEAILTYTDPSGNEAQKIISGAIPSPQPQTHYKITVNSEMVNGEVSININVNEELTEIEYNLGSSSSSIINNRIFGTSESDKIIDMISTSDGGYLLLISDSSPDALIYKLNQQGEIQWEKNEADYRQKGILTNFLNVIEAEDGYVFCGVIQLGAESGQNISDAWIVKVNYLGEKQWEKNYGIKEYEDINSISKTADGFLLSGSTSNEAEPGNFYILRINEDGERIWDKEFGGSSNEVSYSSSEDKAGNYVIAGVSKSEDGDVVSNAGGDDIWVLKLDQDGQILWQKVIGGSGFERATKVLVNADNEYILTGGSNSADINFSNINFGSVDIWSAALDEDGNLIWLNTYGGSDFEDAADMVTFNDKYLLVGRSSSDDGDITNPLGGSDIWTLLIDGNGNLLEQYSFGGSNEDIGVAISVNDGNLVTIAGTSKSSDVDVPINMGESDVWWFQIIN